jgi:AraC-like DNA-binding protein
MNVVSQFFDIFIGGAFFCSLLVSLVLIFRSNPHGRANQMLALSMMSLAGFIFQHILTIHAGDSPFAAMSRTGFPFVFLAPAFVYFYTCELLGKTALSRKKAWLHFIPAVLSLLNWAITFPEAEAWEQRLFWLLLDQQGAAALTGMGLMPFLTFFILLPGQYFFYLTLHSRQLVGYLRASRRAGTSGVNGQGKWLPLVLLLWVLIYTIMAWTVFIPGNLWLEGTIFISTCLLALSSYLILNPELLYGPFSLQAPGNAVAAVVSDAAAPVTAPLAPEQPERVKPGMLPEEAPVADVLPEEPVMSERPLQMTPDQVTFYGRELVNYLSRTEIFRRQGISINELAVALQIPARQLSYVINQHFHQRFNDLINSYRVDYIIDRLHKDDWRSMTLEGLAAEAGFSSRSTFFTAFKKVTSLNPTQFMQQLPKMTG